MNMINQLILEGFVESVRTTQDNTLFPGPSVTCLVVSTSRVYHNEMGKAIEETSFIDVEAWGNLGEFAGSIRKGSGIRIVGRLKQNRWESDGKELSKVVVVAEHIEVKPAKKESSDENKD